MKELDITPEVIAKAKEIASLWRMDVYVGDWILFGALGGKVRLVDYKFKEHLDATGYGDDCLIPIPSISDCLEKLKEMKLRYIFHEHELGKVCVSIISDDMLAVPVDNLERYSLHLALLSALLEVLTNA